MGVPTLTRARIARVSPKTSFPRGTSTIFTFKMAMQKLRRDTTISLMRVVVVMITGVV